MPTLSGLMIMAYRLLLEQVLREPLFSVLLLVQSL
jgi:hypothetical protein